MATWLSTALSALLVSAMIPGGEPAPSAEPTLSPPEAPSRWTFFGDLRNRVEADWDSRRPDGSLRDDRDRYRIRARVGVEYSPREPWKLRVRGRTGSQLSQQSSHWTLHDFEGGPDGDRDAVLDQWFVEGTWKRFSFWAGRNQFPFFYASDSQEMLWDKDATLTGGFFSWRLSEHFTANVGGFALPEGMDRWHGSLWAGQILARRSVRESWNLKAAASFLGIEGGGASRRLLDGNGSRDYRIGVLSAQSLRSLGSNPLQLGYVRFGVDAIHNFSTYSRTSTDPVTARFHDDTDGFILSLALGEGDPGRRQRWDWELDYTYGHVETLALNASYAQDDWVRWGSGGQTRSSDFKAHQIGWRVWLRKEKNHSLDLYARSYFAESLSSVEDGNRFRLDLNYAFKF